MSLRTASTSLARSPLFKLGGFGASMLLLAAGSLLLIPEMIRRDGQHGWGAIALGQAVGMVSCVAVAYGWAISGPASVAREEPRERRAEYVDSLTFRLAIFVPIALVSAVVAAVIAHQRPDLAVIGAISAASIGLSANWYYVGRSAPFQMLAYETAPRVGGTVVGLVLMLLGSGAFTALTCQFLGMVSGVAVSTWWVLHDTRGTYEPLPRTPLVEVARRQSKGLGASLASAGYSAAPLLIVTLVAPSIQPAFALVDKLQRQLVVAFSPIVNVLQGWVPRGDNSERVQRMRSSVVYMSGAALSLWLGVIVFGSLIVEWAGGGQISVSTLVLVTMGSIIAVSMEELVLSLAILPVLGRIDAAARATALSALIGLPLVALGATMSIEAALIGLVLGLLARVTMEAFVVRRGLALLAAQLSPQDGVREGTPADLPEEELS